MAQQSRAIEIFCCYAQEDITYLATLKNHLSPLQWQNLIHIGDDGDIRAGTQWDQEIKKCLNEASIILLLISPDFIASEICCRTELPYALARHQQGAATVIPVLLRPVANWDKLSFGDLQLGQLQALPTDTRAVTTWPNYDLAWSNVAEGIGRVVNKLLMIHSSMNQSSLYNQQVVEALAPFSQGDQPEGRVINAHQPLRSQPMELYSPAMEQLCIALLSGYPTAADLKLLIAYELHENIEVIASGSRLDEKIHNLVTWAIKHGQEQVLVAGALKRCPGNPKLRQFATQHGF